MFFLARVLEIMKRDSSKDPATYPDALLAMALVDQVNLYFPDFIRPDLS